MCSDYGCPGLADATTAGGREAVPLFAPLSVMA